MIDVVIYDLDGGYCPPGLSAPVGGSEVELHQLAQMLGRAGLEVALVLGKQAPDFQLGACKTLIYWRQVENVSWCQPARRIVRATDDPQRHCSQVDGLLTVCVSKWQAEKFWTPTRVVYPVLGDHVATCRSGYARWRGRWIYASAANKGARETAMAWLEKPRGDELWMTTTGYDEPPMDIFGPSIKWLGRLTPCQMIDAMSRCGGMFYRNRAPETFGVTTAIAVALGLELDIVCVGHEVCGLAESRVPQDLSESNYVRQWQEILCETRS